MSEKKLGDVSLCVVKHRQKLFTVVGLRKQGQGQFQLNFRDKDRALAAFAALGSLEKPKIIEDDFGSKVRALPEDTGTIVFVDVMGSLEYQHDAAVVQQSHQMDIQERAQRDAALRGGRILVPAGGLNRA